MPIGSSWSIKNFSFAECGHKCRFNLRVRIWCNYEVVKGRCLTVAIYSFYTTLWCLYVWLFISPYDVKVLYHSLNIQRSYIRIQFHLGSSGLAILFWIALLDCTQCIFCCFSMHLSFKKFCNPVCLCSWTVRGADILDQTMSITFLQMAKYIKLEKRRIPW